MSKYLRITIHDNDFISDLQIVGETLKNIFDFEDKYPTEDDLPKIKEYISNLCWSIHNLDNFYRWKDTSVDFSETPMKIFDVDLAIVDYTDIPDWNNSEDVYIPLFAENNDILLV